MSIRPEIISIHTPTPFPVGASNCYLVLDDPVTLIDAGTSFDAAWHSLEAAIREQGLQVSDIERILLTHHHLDHVGLIARILEQSNAEIWAHPQTTNAIRLSYAYDEAAANEFFPLMRYLGVPSAIAQQAWDIKLGFTPTVDVFPVRSFEEGVPVGRFTPYFVPGHALTDVLLIDPDAGITFSGDHILEDTTPNPILRTAGPEKERPKSLLEYRESLKRTRSMDLGTCYPGHGVSFEDHQRVVDMILTQQEKKAAQIIEVMGDSLLHPYTLSTLLYPDHPLELFYLCLSIAIAHLEYLESIDRVVSSECSGVIYYSMSKDH